MDNIVHELAAETGVKEDEVLSRIEKLSEVNPMLGFRGCRFLTISVSLSVSLRLKNNPMIGKFVLYRLGISYPELTEMQARAIFEAAASMQDQGVTVLPEIMVPLVGTPQVMYTIYTLATSLKKKICNFVQNKAF